MSDFKELAEKTVVELFDMVKEKVVEIHALKAQLNNMEQCYIQLKQEHNDLLAFNEKLDRERNGYRKDARKYAKKIQMIADLLRSPTDKEMTLKAIKTVIDRVGEHG